MMQYSVSGRYAFRITVGFVALTILLLTNGVGAISNNDSCIAINNSYTTPCAEFDNVNIPLFGNITSFVIEATHPTYNVGGNYSCATNFTNCPNPGDPTYPNYPDYPFTAHNYTLFDDGETVIQAVREALWWQPRGMNASVNSDTPVTDIHSIRVSRKIAGANEWPQFFVLYSDGNARLIPHPPVESTSVCFGSSVIIGPATVAERPIANISSVRYISSSKTMEVIYREGGSAILSLNEVNRSMARVKVTVNFSTDILPFTTFRSMYVSDGNADVDHVRWQDISGVIHNESIMVFLRGEGSDWLFYRSNWSMHNPSGPDIAIKNFITPTPQIVLTPRIFVNISAFPATLPIGGGNVTYSYKVVNTGNLVLSNISLIDDKCVPAVYVSGDLNSNSELETTETWNYVCENRINETTTNTVTGTGSYKGSPVSDSDTATVTVAIPTPTPYVGSSSGGSGGGGDGGVGEKYSNIEMIEKYDLQISKDVLTSYRFTDAKNPIMFVNITGNTSLGIITTSIQVLKNISTLMNVSPDGLVYRNANIWVGTAGFATPKNIKEAVIKFRVDNGWMSTNGVSASDIVLVKWDGTSWIRLETKVLPKDNTNTYFEGRTNSFSPFAIVAKTTTVIESTVTMTPVETPKVTATGAPEPTKKAPGFGIVLALLGLTAVVFRKRI
jgi:PGF-pre-PGF domain-containing protein